ncbi:hypothetical protein NDU88_000079 [Pleurodeles waltl]|uniref:Uncharacterized protein n=1 Tax=Pleurodeles waltl TaxID=8319 RepID=A0AAV7Q205_PLEWA|nr:hypothetical protein NDU88_000079 [Pleurodeles waltl]
MSTGDKVVRWVNEYLESRGSNEEGTGKSTGEYWEMKDSMMMQILKEQDRALMRRVLSAGRPDKRVLGDVLGVQRKSRCTGYWESMGGYDVQSTGRAWEGTMYRVLGEHGRVRCTEYCEQGRVRCTEYWKRWRGYDVLSTGSRGGYDALSAGRDGEGTMH